MKELYDSPTLTGATETPSDQNTIYVIFSMRIDLPVFLLFLLCQVIFKHLLQRGCFAGNKN